MKRGDHLPYLSWSLFGICLLFAIATSVNPSMYEYFACWSQPKYIWQAVSGIFMHGSRYAPAWYRWVHFGTNMLMIVPLGRVIEKRLGTLRILQLVLCAWIAYYAVFKLCFLHVQQSGTGISSIGYSFGPVAYILLLKEYRKKNGKRNRTALSGYLLLLTAMVVMLCPLITSLISFLLHLSGVLAGSLYCLYLHKKRIL